MWYENILKAIIYYYNYYYNYFFTMTHFSFGYITALTAVGKKDTDNHGYLFMCPFFMCQWGKLFLSHFQSFVEFYFFVRSKKKKGTKIINAFYLGLI